MKPVINLPSGAVFKNETGIFVKLMNPEIPRLAKISNYPVWAADVGNGRIYKFEPFEQVVFIGHCFDLMQINQGVEMKSPRKKYMTDPETLMGNLPPQAKVQVAVRKITFSQ